MSETTQIESASSVLLIQTCPLSDTDPDPPQRLSLRYSGSSRETRVEGCYRGDDKHPREYLIVWTTDADTARVLKKLCNAGNLFQVLAPEEERGVWQVIVITYEDRDGQWGATFDLRRHWQTDANSTLDYPLSQWRGAGPL